MKDYIYRFADGTKSIVAVDDELYDLLTEMDKQEKYGNRRETRRHLSLESLAEKAVEIPVTDAYDFAELFPNLQDDELKAAIEKLDGKQKDLLHSVFYKRMTLKEIASEEKVSPQNISWRLRAILSQLQINR